MLFHDVIIVGAGPAGLNASIYAARAGLDLRLFDLGTVGGQLLKTNEIDNYLGFYNMDGFDMAQKFTEHAQSLGVNIENEYVEKINVVNGGFEVNCGNKNFYAKTVIASSGSKRRLLGVPGEERLTGMGVSYCAICDGNFFRKKVAVVVGGGDTAVEDALYMAKICTKVYLVHRRDAFRAAHVSVVKLKQTENIEIIYNANVVEINGDEKVESVTIKHNSGEISKVDTSCVFIAVGEVPETNYLPDSVNKEVGGGILTDEGCRTNIPGLFAAGDIRKKELRQIITAAADGAIAANNALAYLQTL